MPKVYNQYSKNLVRTGKTISNSAGNYEQQDAYTKGKATDTSKSGGRYGSSGTDAVYYNIPLVKTGNIIKASEWERLRNAIEQEKSRRNKSIHKESNARSNYYNYNFDALLQKVGNIIEATEYNSIVNVINAMGKECVCYCNYCSCDCNYCSCNCNYCTCNCHYVCTCNCNYEGAANYGE